MLSVLSVLNENLLNPGCLTWRFAELGNLVTLQRKKRTAKITNKMMLDARCTSFLATFLLLLPSEFGYPLFFLGTPNFQCKCDKNDYYVADFASGQDKANPVFRLATRAGKMGPPEIARFVPAKANLLAIS